MGAAGAGSFSPRDRACSCSHHYALSPQVIVSGVLVTPPDSLAVYEMDPRPRLP